MAKTENKLKLRLFGKYLLKASFRQMVILIILITALFSSVILIKNSTENRSRAGGGSAELLLQLPEESNNIIVGNRFPVEIWVDNTNLHPGMPIKQVKLELNYGPNEMPTGPLWCLNNNSSLIKANAAAEIKAKFLENITTRVRPLFCDNPNLQGDNAPEECKTQAEGMGLTPNFLCPPPPFYENIIEPDIIEAGEAFPIGSYNIRSIDTQRKVIKITATAKNPGEYVSGKKKLATVYFRAVKTGNVTLSFNYDPFFRIMGPGVGNNINVKLAEGKQAAVLGAATELAQAQITPRVSCPDYIGSTCPAGQKLISVPGRNGCNLPKCVPDVCPTSGNFAVCPIPTQGYCRGQWIYPQNNYDTCGCSQPRCVEYPKITSITAIDSLGNDMEVLLTQPGSLVAYITDNVPPPPAEINLAAGKRVYASSTWIFSKPENVNDGNYDTTWNSGGKPPAAIEINLEGKYNVGRVEMIVSQSGQGKTTHNLYVYKDGGYKKVKTFSGETKSGDILKAILSPVEKDVTGIKLETVESESWISWKEIQVYGGEDVNVETRDSIIVIGGHIEGNIDIDHVDSITNQVQKYDPATNSWISLPPTNYRRGDSAAVTLGNQIYVFGDAFKAGSRQADHYGEVYDGQSNIWSVISAPPGLGQVLGLNAFGYDNNILLIYNTIENSSLKTVVYIYDPGSDSYKKKTSPSVSVEKCVENENKISCFERDSYKYVWNYQRSNDTWEKTPVINGMFLENQLVNTGSEIYTLAGSVGNNNIYRFKDNMLQPVLSIPFEDKPVSEPVMGKLGNALIIAGGKKGKQALNKVYIYNKGILSTLPPLPNAIARGVMVAFPPIAKEVKTGGNLAFKKRTTASGTWFLSNSDNGVDENIDTTWNSGGHPPQWLMVDLGEPFTIAKIEAVVAQSGEDKTTHIFSVTTGDYREKDVKTFSQKTKSGDLLTATFDPPLTDVIRVKVKTTESSSWVAWREIRAFGPEKIVCKTGVNSLGGEEPCTDGYRYAVYTCYDGSGARMGDANTCKSLATWKSYATSFCANSSSCSQPKRISWKTKDVTLEANDFWLDINGKRYYGEDAKIDVRSDPAGQKDPDFTTLEATWLENGVEMRMFMYFKLERKTGKWTLYDLRTYDGQVKGEWIYYDVVANNNYGNGTEILPKIEPVTARLGVGGAFGNYDFKSLDSPKNKFHGAVHLWGPAKIEPFLNQVIPVQTGCIQTPVYNGDDCIGYRAVTSLTNISSACYTFDQCKQALTTGVCAKSPTYLGDSCGPGDGYRIIPGIYTGTNNGCLSLEECNKLLTPTPVSPTITPVPPSPTLCVARNTCGGWGGCSAGCGQNGTQSRSCSDGCGRTWTESQGCYGGACPPPGGGGGCSERNDCGDGQNCCRGKCLPNNDPRCN